jgi:hypothetical protein
MMEMAMAHVCALSGYGMLQGLLEVGRRTVLLSPCVCVKYVCALQAINEGRGPRQDPREVEDNYKFTPHALSLVSCM